MAGALAYAKPGGAFQGLVWGLRALLWRFLVGEVKLLRVNLPKDYTE